MHFVTELSNLFSSSGFFFSEAGKEQSSHRGLFNSKERGVWMMETAERLALFELKNPAGSFQFVSDGGGGV